MPDLKKNKKIVQKYYKALDSGEAASCLELLTDDYQVHFASVPNPVPRAGLADFNGAFWNAFPNFTHTILDQFAEGNKVSTRLEFRAVHKGEFQGVPATNKEVTFEALNVSKIRGGKICEHWAYPDMVSLMVQIGAIKKEAA